MGAANCRSAATPSSGTHPDDLVKPREQCDQPLRLIIAIEFAYRLSAIVAVSWKLLSRLDQAVDPWDEDELQPLAEAHGVDGECRAKFILLWPQGFALPIADSPHLMLDLGDLRLYAIPRRTHRLFLLVLWLTLLGLGAGASVNLADPIYTSGWQSDTNNLSDAPFAFY